MQILFTAIVLFLLSLFAGRMISEHAMKKLSLEDKAKLIDAFSKSRIYQLAILIGIIIIYYIFSVNNTLSKEQNFFLYFLLIMLYMASRIIMSYLRLRKLEFPGDFIRGYIGASALSLLGMLGLFAGVYLQFLS